MPFYKFKCADCGKERDVTVSWSSLEQMIDTTGSLKERCECGGELKREYGDINLGPDIYKNDPRSNGYWKRGKTNGEIANILNNTTANPY